MTDGESLWSVIPQPVTHYDWLPGAARVLPRFPDTREGGRVWEHYHNEIIRKFSEALSYTARVDEVVEYMALVTKHDSNRYQMLYSTMSYTREVTTLFHRVDDWLYHTIIRPDDLGA